MILQHYISYCASLHFNYSGVVEELTRDKVLVTEWVEGTRLDKDASPDVPRLCGVAINAYLTMLLDTGVLHWLVI